MSVKICNLGNSSTDIQSATIDTAWTTVDVTTTVSVNTVEWSPDLGTNGRLVALPDNGSTVSAYSDDGSSWTATTILDKNWNAVIWSQELSLFVAVGGSGATFSNPLVSTSSDGITWDTATATAVITWNSIAWAPKLGLFCAVSQSGVAGENVMTSPDGTNWTSQTAVVSGWSCVTWSPKLGLFAAFSSGGGLGDRVMTSPDGSTWTTQTLGGSDNAWQDIVWSPENEIFCAVSLNTVAATSDDGSTWVTQTTPLGVSSLVWASNISLFCAVSVSSTDIMTSVTGLSGSWTSQSTVFGPRTDLVWASSFQNFYMSPVSGGHIVKSNSDYSAYETEATIGTSGVTDITIAAQNLSLGQSAAEVTIGQYANQMTIGSPGTQVSINGNLFLYNTASRDILTNLSPDIWIANGETTSRVGSNEAVTLNNDAKVISESSVSRSGFGNPNKYVWQLSTSTQGSSVDIAATIDAYIGTGNMFYTMAWAITLPPWDTRTGETPYLSVQLVSDSNPDTNHSVRTGTSDYTQLLGDEFDPSGGGWTANGATPSYWNWPGGRTGDEPKSILVVRRDGTGTSISIFYNGIETADATTNESYTGNTPTFTRIGWRNTAAASNTAYGLTFAGYAAWERALSDAEIQTITYENLSAI